MFVVFFSLLGDRSIWRHAKNRHRLWNGSTILKIKGKTKRENSRYDLTMPFVYLCFFWRIISVCYCDVFLSFLALLVKLHFIYLENVFFVIRRKTTVARRTHMFSFFSFGSWWDVISCRHRHAYKPWWQLPAISFFLLSLLVFYFVPANITWTFHRQNLSRFSSLVQTPGLVSCLFNVYIHTVRV